MISFDEIRKGKKIEPELLEKYVNIKLSILESWIKKIKEFFFQIDFAIDLLERQGFDTNLLVLKVEKKREELESI
jgi:hypothetical protein